MLEAAAAIYMDMMSVVLDVDAAGALCDKGGPLACAASETSDFMETTDVSLA